MTRINNGFPGSQQPEPAAQDTIYTVLVIIATLFVAAATIYLGYRVFELFGTIFPPSGG
jgi:hypothetical protein